jgi:hypothetical protein
MPQSWSSQDGDDPDDVDAWMARRNALVALRPEAEAAGRDLWNRAIQAGDDLYAGNPSDLTALGLAALGGATSRLTPAANDDGQNSGGGAFHQQPALSADPAAPSPSHADDPWVSQLDVVGGPPDRTAHPGFLDSLNHNPVARTVAGVAGYALGLPGGALRGGWHALEGVGHGLNFAGGLIVSPNARAEAWDGARAATHDALQYGRSVVENPSRLAGDAVSGAKAANRSLNPFATPIPGTASGAFSHELGIGANGGETIANIVGAFAAPEFAAGVNAARTFAATRDANIAEMVARGIDEPTALRLSKRYKGQGDHALIQKRQPSILGFETPWLEGARIPKWFMDGPLNVSKPRGLSQYDFYKYHYGVDPNFKGGRLPNGPDGPRGFSGRGLGFERYDQPGRTWRRIPQIWKDYYTGTAVGEALGLLPGEPSETPQ